MATPLLIVDIASLIGGAEVLIRAATRLASVAKVSPSVIGLTVVAFGTSSPEMAVSVHVACAGQAGIALGNIVGCNLFNILGVLGLSAALAPYGNRVQPAALRIEISVMLAVAVAGLPVFVTGTMISRWEEIHFLAYDAAYMIYLILDATQNRAIATFNLPIGFVLPLLGSGSFFGRRSAAFRSNVPAEKRA